MINDPQLDRSSSNDFRIAKIFIVFIVGPRRYTNVFDESKINRIR